MKSNYDFDIKEDDGMDALFEMRCSGCKDGNIPNACAICMKQRGENHKIFKRHYLNSISSDTDLNSPIDDKYVEEMQAIYGSES